MINMKRVLAVTLVTTGLLVGGVIVAAPSQAKTPKTWMTKTEFNYVFLDKSYGDTLSEVRYWVGGKGTLGYVSTWYEDRYCKRWNYSYTACVEYAGGVRHTTKIYYWRTSNRARYGGSVMFEDGHATSKSYYR